MDLLSVFIPTANAADAAAATGAAGESSFAPMFLLFLIIGMMYFLIWRPQNKQKKQHIDLVTNTAVGDEIVTGGGIVGKVIAIDGPFVQLQVANNVEIKVQKASISSALPKGSVKF